MLEKVCSLDWSDPMTPDGAVASASVAKVTCDIARNDVDGDTGLPDLLPTAPSASTCSTRSSTQATSSACPSVLPTTVARPPDR